MNRESLYTVWFATLVCGVCAIGVCLAAVMLRPRQEENKILDRQLQVLRLAGYIADGQVPDAGETKALFSANVRPRLLVMKDGSLDAAPPAADYDYRVAAANPATGHDAPPNDAKVRRLPEKMLVYLISRDGALDMIILPVQGMGLWSTLYGYLAVATDGNTIRGLSFYEHAETPGLGAEVDNPVWKARWKGRRIFADGDVPAIKVIKGAAGPSASDPYRVDGLSGATLTGRGVEKLLHFWLGEQAYGPFLKRLARGELR